MRTLFIKDQDIPQDEFDETVKEVRELYEQHAGINIPFEVHDWSIPNLPFVVYYNNFRGISQSYLKSLAMMIEAHHGRKFDQITIVVADHNWTPSEDGIWGWNISAGIRGYEVQQCRFDTVRKDREGRIVNSVGTMFHEMMHSHDGFCYRMLGGKVERMFKEMNSWDDEVVHGQGAEWEYIRHKENTEALHEIRYLLQASVKERERQFNEGRSTVQGMKEAFRENVIKATEPYAKPCFISNIQAYESDN